VERAAGCYLDHKVPMLQTLLSSGDRIPICLSLWGVRSLRRTPDTHTHTHTHTPTHTQHKTTTTPIQTPTNIHTHTAIHTHTHTQPFLTGHFTLLLNARRLCCAVKKKSRCFGHSLLYECT